MAKWQELGVALESSVSVPFVTCAHLCCDNDVCRPPSGAAEGSGWISEEGTVLFFEFYVSTAMPGPGK